MKFSQVDFVSSIWLEFIVGIILFVCIVRQAVVSSSLFTDLYSIFPPLKCCGSDTAKIAVEFLFVDF